MGLHHAGPCPEAGKPAWPTNRICSASTQGSDRRRTRTPCLIPTRCLRRTEAPGRWTVEASNAAKKGSARGPAGRSRAALLRIKKCCPGGIPCAPNLAMDAPTLALKSYRTATLDGSLDHARLYLATNTPGAPSAIPWRGRLTRKEPLQNV